MRLAIAQPCLGSSEIVLRIRRSRVPWTKSLGFPMFTIIYNSAPIVDRQGMSSWIDSGATGEQSYGGSFGSEWRFPGDCNRVALDLRPARNPPIHRTRRR